MDLPIFTPKTTAELLGITPKALRSALSQESYTAQDLWALRKALRIHPRPLGRRKQLFLNFKGGTGKTSLSTSYSYRLAELGYSVLLVDLARELGVTNERVIEAAALLTARGQVVRRGAKLFVA